MATRAEQYRAGQARRGRSNGAKQKAGSKPGLARSDRSHSKVHAAKKASYALEPERAARPSRKSTRKSANRAKADASLNLREQLQKGSPEARFRKSQVRSRPA